MKKRWSKDKDHLDVFVVLIGLLVVLGVLMASMWFKLRRELIILIWGYGGDVVEAVIAGIHAFFDLDYAKKKLKC